MISIRKKRRWAAVFGIILLAAAGCLGAKAFGTRTSESGEGLSVLSCSVRIEEESGLVETELLLENTGSSSLEKELLLPRISAGIREGSLFLEASGETERTAEDRLWLRIPARETLWIRYRYTAAENLVNAGAIGLDLTQEPFSEGQKIGRLLFSLTLREEDIPLVREIRPQNWRFDGRSVSLELRDFRPSQLLDRLVVAKDSYRNLKGSREYEPTEEQLYVLDHCRQWFREGLDADPGLWPEYRSSYLYCLLNELSADQAYLHGGNARKLQKSLRQGSDSYQHILEYLAVRELLRSEEALALLRERTDRVMLGAGEPEADLAPLTRELLRQALFGTELHLFTVQPVSEPALAGVHLCRYRLLNEGTGAHDYPAITETEALTSRPTSWYQAECFFWALPYRTVVLPRDRVFGAEELEDFLAATDSEVFVRQKLLDARGREPDLSFGNEELGVALYALPEGAALTEREWTEAAGSVPDRWPHRRILLKGEDPLLGALPIPAFIHYAGIVTEKKGRTLLEVFSLGSYLSREGGVSLYARIAGSEAGQQLLKKREAARRTEAEETDRKIRAAAALTLRTVSFRTEGDTGALRVLDYSLEYREDSSVVRVSLLLSNDGSEAVTACIPLPLPGNRMTEESLRIDGGGLSVVCGTSLYGTIPAGESIRVTLRGQTETLLSNAGAVGMDLRKLVFSPEGRIGRFSVSVRLLEEDVPLVKEIFPVNYRFDGETVSLTLTDFCPGPLLERFYLTKETYRNLKGSREFELNGTERWILKNYRRLFRDGLGIPPEALSDPDETPRSLFSAALKFYEDGRTLSEEELSEHTKVFGEILLHLCVREYLRQDGGAQAAYEKLRPAYRSGLPLLTREFLKAAVFEEEPVIAALWYAEEPTLAGVQLYASRYESDFEPPVLYPVEEIPCLRSDVGMIQVVSDPGLANMRLAIVSEKAPSAEDLREYLRVTGVSLLIKEMLLDDRDGSWDRIRIPYGWDSDSTWFGDGVWSVPAGGPLTETMLRDAFAAFVGGREELSFLEWSSPNCFEREEPFFPDLPVFTQYFGRVSLREGKAVVSEFPFGPVRVGAFGIAAAPEIVREAEKAGVTKN